MSLIDTHTHIYLPEFDADREEMIQRAQDVGVEAICLPNIDLDSVSALQQVISDYPKYAFGMMGLHPCSVQENYISQLNQIESILNQYSYWIAVGEIGLDRYWSLDLYKQQEAAFEIQCRWAAELQLPVSIHSREATQESIDIVRKVHNEKPFTGVFHCFSGTIDQARQIIEMGFYLGVGGVVTYKKSNLPEILLGIGLNHVVLETDAPYLAPVPYRGKRNECGYLSSIVQVIANKLQLEPQVVHSTTTFNAKIVFQKLVC